MISITWAGHRCVQEAAAILGSQNRTQGHCVEKCGGVTPEFLVFVCEGEKRDTFLLAILKTLTSTFHLIFSDFMFILWLGNIVGEQEQ